MLKPKKKLNYKEYSKKVTLEKKIKSILRLRKNFKNKSYFINPNFQFLRNKKFNYSQKINIRVTPNNVFCTLQNIFKNKTLKIGSAGLYNIKTTKKTLKYSIKNILTIFLDKIKKFIKSKTILINIIGPIKTRKIMLKILSKYLTNKKLVINIEELKCFNGCRPPKKRRKKQKGLRILK
jgi:ribosomal protein S11